MPAFSLAWRPRLDHSAASPATRRSPTHPHPWPRPGRIATGTCGSATASAVCLSPATLSARNHLTSELLRTLSRVAASKPTSWLSLRLHLFPLSTRLGALADDLGCFPLDYEPYRPQSHCHALTYRHSEFG